MSCATQPFLCKICNGFICTIFPGHFLKIQGNSDKPFLKSRYGTYYCSPTSAEKSNETSFMPNFV